MDENIFVYIDHYLKTKESLLFLIVTAVVLGIVLTLFYIYSAIWAGNKSEVNVKAYREEKFDYLCEMLYELVFSGGSILMFMAVYYLINRFFFVEPYRSFWDKYNDFLLLLLIVISIFTSRIVDNILVRLKAIDHSDKAAIRLIAMGYMILIFCYIKFIYENNNYDMFISYFLGLMIGRFVYFDASLKDFTHALGAAFKKTPIMIIALAITAVLSFYGFKTEFLIKHIGVVTNVFFIHIYLTVVIFVINIFRQIIKRARRG